MLYAVKNDNEKINSVLSVKCPTSRHSMLRVEYIPKNTKKT